MEILYDDNEQKKIIYIHSMQISDTRKLIGKEYLWELHSEILHKVKSQK